MRDTFVHKIAQSEVAESFHTAAAVLGQMNIETSKQKLEPSK